MKVEFVRETQNPEPTRIDEIRLVLLSAIQLNQSLTQHDINTLMPGVRTGPALENLVREQDILIVKDGTILLTAKGKHAAVTYFGVPRCEFNNPAFKALAAPPASVLLDPESSFGHTFRALAPVIESLKALTVTEREGVMKAINSREVRDCLEELRQRQLILVKMTKRGDKVVQVQLSKLGQAWLTSAKSRVSSNGEEKPYQALGQTISRMVQQIFLTEGRAGIADLHRMHPAATAILALTAIQIFESAPIPTFYRALGDYKTVVKFELRHHHSICDQEFEKLYELLRTEAFLSPHKLTLRALLTLALIARDEAIDRKIGRATPPVSHSSLLSAELIDAIHPAEIEVQRRLFVIEQEIARLPKDYFYESHEVYSVVQNHIAPIAVTGHDIEISKLHGARNRSLYKRRQDRVNLIQVEPVIRWESIFLDRLLFPFHRGHDSIEKSQRSRPLKILSPQNELNDSETSEQSEYRKRQVKDYILAHRALFKRIKEDYPKFEHERLASIACRFGIEPLTTISMVLEYSIPLELFETLLDARRESLHTEKNPSLKELDELREWIGKVTIRGKLRTLTPTETWVIPVKVLKQRGGVNGNGKKK